MIIGHTQYVGYVLGDLAFLSAVHVTTIKTMQMGDLD